MSERLEAGAEVNNSMKRQKRRKRQHKQQQKVGVEEDALSADSHREPLLRGIFQIGKKSHDVVLTTSRITWTPIQPEDPTGQSAVKKLQGDFVDLTDVFAVKVKRRRSVGQKSGGTLLGITVFIGKRKGAKLKDHAIHLNNLSADHCEIWFKHLKDILNGFQNRPKSLKVFINPSSHKKEAYQVYVDQVAPLFKLADIQTDVTVTERKGHAVSVLKECSLGEYDGGGCSAVLGVIGGGSTERNRERERERERDLSRVVFSRVSDNAMIRAVVDQDARGLCGRWLFNYLYWKQ
ncbi:hypothetical protein MHYP_G00063180 [Metynnis hypsauchen]